MALALRGTAVGVEQTPAGRRLVVRRSVDVPAAVVWDVLTDTHRWPDWGPSVSGVESPDRYVTSGSRGRVQIGNAVWLPFEITSATNYRWTWTVAGLDATGHFVKRRPDGCAVGFEIPLATACYLPVCVIATARIERIATRIGGTEN